MGLPQGDCEMKVHLGCGKRVLDGWINVDIQTAPGAPRAPDVFADIRGVLPFADDSADEVMAIHVFEHFYRWECDKIIKEWSRVLKPGGLLVLELPDLVKCARNFLELHAAGGKPVHQMALWGIYGDDTLRDPYQCHRYGWWPESLRAFLDANGFTCIKTGTPEWHRAGRDNRDMRITARKL